MIASPSSVYLFICLSFTLCVSLLWQVVHMFFETLLFTITLLLLLIVFNFRSVYIFFHAVSIQSSEFPPPVCKYVCSEVFLCTMQPSSGRKRTYVCSILRWSHFRRLSRKYIQSLLEENDSICRSIWSNSSNDCYYMC